MIRTVHIKHILLTHYYPDPIPYQDKFVSLINNCELWWRSRGVELEFADHGTFRFGHQINLANQNPWPQALSWWMQQPDYDPSVIVMLFLFGWNDPWYIGWGGRPLALVGDYAISRIASVGTPEAIVDDGTAGKLVLHEEGHALGLSHDFEFPNAVMGYSDSKWNAVLGDKSWEELRSQPAGALDYLHVEGCKKDVA